MSRYYQIRIKLVHVPFRGEPPGNKGPPGRNGHMPWGVAVSPRLLSSPRWRFPQRRPRVSVLPSSAIKSEHLDYHLDQQPIPILTTMHGIVIA